MLIIITILMVIKIYDENEDVDADYDNYETFGQSG